MIERAHELLTLILYVIVFLAPVFISEAAMKNLNSYYLNDRMSEFLEEAGDGVTVTEYAALDKIVVEMGGRLVVSIDKFGEFYIGDELMSELERTGEIEIVPGTLIEVYIDIEDMFLYDSKLYYITSGEL